MIPFSIGWHEACLESHKLSHENLVRKANDAAAAVVRSQQRIDEYQRKIARAKRLGKTSFDPDRFKADPAQPTGGAK